VHRATGRTALGWWWDFVFYDVVGGSVLLMFIIGWVLFLAPLPIIGAIALVQLILGGS
jgi:hypothetical protein